MINAIELEKGVAGERKITFRAYFGKQQGKITLSPVRSKSTGRLLGVPLYTDEMRKVAVKVIDAETERTIEDGTVIDRDDPIDALDWEWMKYCPELKGSLEDCYDSPQALFYIENVTRDTEQRVKQRNLKKKAFEYIANASPAKLEDVLRLLKLDPKSFSRLETEDYLGELADTNPKKLVDVFEDDLMKVKLFLIGLVEAKLVEVDQDGIYRYGAYVLGTSEKSALIWLQLSENAAMIKRMRDELYPAPTVASSTSGELPTTPPPVKDEELEKAKAKERYYELFGKGVGSMKLENILEKIAEKESELQKKTEPKKENKTQLDDFDLDDTDVNIEI